MRLQWSSLCSVFLIIILSLVQMRQCYQKDFHFWLNQYNTYCGPNEVKQRHSLRRCSSEYGKMYIFIEQRKTLSQSQKHCTRMYEQYNASDLVVFGSCDEYLFVQSFLLDIANDRRDLWDQENGSKRLETWTNSDKIPDTDGDSEVMEDETDVSACSTNNTFAIPSAATAAESDSYNLTTSFRTWDRNDESEKRYPICQLKFGQSFWEAGRWKFPDFGRLDDVRPSRLEITGGNQTQSSLENATQVTDRAETVTRTDFTVTMTHKIETTVTEPVSKTPAERTVTVTFPRMTEPVTTDPPVTETTTTSTTTEEMVSLDPAESTAPKTTNSTEELEIVAEESEVVTESTPEILSEEPEEPIVTTEEVLFTEIIVTSSTPSPSPSITEITTTETATTETATTETATTETATTETATTETTTTETTTTETTTTKAKTVTSEPLDTTGTVALTQATVQTDEPLEISSEPDHIYEETQNEIDVLRQSMKHQHGALAGGPAKEEVVAHANDITRNLVTHWKTDDQKTGHDVQAFISCMRGLNEIVHICFDEDDEDGEDHGQEDNALEGELDGEKGKESEGREETQLLVVPQVKLPNRLLVQRAMNFSRLAVDGFSTLLNTMEPWTKLDHVNRSKSAVAMVDQVHHLSFTLGCLAIAPHQQIREPNIMMQVFGMENGIIGKDFSFPQSEDGSDGGADSLVPKQSEVRFTSPVKVVRNSCGRHVASGIVYQNLAHHMLPPDMNDTMSINSQLVSFSLSNTSESMDLANGSKVQLTFRHMSPLKFGDVSRCVFWDVKRDNWSEHRCELVHELSSRNQTVCQCDHLTNFAILMDISSRERDDEVKHILTLVCSSLSIGCLTLTICCLVFVKSLRNRRSVITSNLSACLLISNLLVVGGFDQTEDVMLCRVVSGLTLYSLLSAFMWMLMEGYLLYQMIILVFRSVGHLNTATIYCLSYLPPAVVLIVFVAVTGYEGLFDPEYAYFCWISNSHNTSYIWSFAGPALAIAFINAIILTKSFIAAIESQKKKNKQQQAVSAEAPASNPSGNKNSKCSGKTGRLENIGRWLKGWTSLLILVGLTWLSGLLYIHQSISWMSHVFICLNGCQGVLIFLFEIVLNCKTRTALMTAMKLHIPASASRYLTSLSKTSSNNLSSVSKTTRDSHMSQSPTGSQSNLSRNIKDGSSCSLNYCAHVVREPDGKDFSPHHLFHHHHEVPRLVMHEKFGSQSSLAKK